MIPEWLHMGLVGLGIIVFAVLTWACWEGAGESYANPRRAIGHSMGLRWLGAAMLCGCMLCVRAF